MKGGKKDGKSGRNKRRKEQRKEETREWRTKGRKKQGNEETREGREEGKKCVCMLMYFTVKQSTRLLAHWACLFLYLSMIHILHDSSRSASFTVTGTACYQVRVTPVDYPSKILYFSNLKSLSWRTISSVDYSLKNIFKYRGNSEIVDTTFSCGISKLR